MGIREDPVIRHATLPDGDLVEVRVVVPDDPYIPRAELDTVVVELERAGAPIGVVETPLSSDDADVGQLLAERIRLALESGAVEPTAEGIEHLALTPPV
jgi:hypothetical protein